MEPIHPSAWKERSMRFVCSIIERIFYVARKAAKYPRGPLSVRS